MFSVVDTRDQGGALELLPPEQLVPFLVRPVGESQQNLLGSLIPKNFEWKEDGSTKIFGTFTDEGEPMGSIALEHMAAYPFDFVQDWFGFYPEDVFRFTGLTLSESIGTGLQRTRALSSLLSSAVRRAIQGSINLIVGLPDDEVMKLFQQGGMRFMVSPISDEKSKSPYLFIPSLAIEPCVELFADVTNPLDDPQRLWRRAPVNTEVRVMMENQEITGVMTDLSMGGCGIVLPDHVSAAAGSDLILSGVPGWTGEQCRTQVMYRGHQPDHKSIRYGLSFCHETDGLLSPHHRHLLRILARESGV